MKEHIFTMAFTGLLTTLKHLVFYLFIFLIPIRFQFLQLKKNCYHEGFWNLILTVNVGLFHNLYSHDTQILLLFEMEILIHV